MTRDEKLGKFGPGTWIDEPDHVAFEHAGLACIVHRTEVLGHLCGYVAVGPRHPVYDQGYDDVDVDVHGGLTYAQRNGDVIGNVDTPDAWWLGFDCAHCNDLIPVAVRLLGSNHPHADVYRDIYYVTAQVKYLAEQLKAARE